jgi:hypothetical protein
MRVSIYFVFLFGFLGSCAVEVVKLYEVYNSDLTGKKPLPKRYKRIGFWIIRLILAIMAGGLAVAYEIDKPLLAINIGAATPLIIQALGQGVKNPISVEANTDPKIK